MKVSGFLSVSKNRELGQVIRGFAAARCGKALPYRRASYLVWEATPPAPGGASRLK